MKIVTVVILGLASWYSLKGQTTASGTVMRPMLMTAAHPTLPFGTYLEVTNLENNKTVVVEVNDRGPYVEGRIIDLSKGAAEQLEMVEDGVVPVRITVLTHKEKRDV